MRKKITEFRKDLVSGDWVLVSANLNGKPVFFKRTHAQPFPKSKCPFEDPRASGHEKILSWYPAPGKNEIENWWVVVFPNKYPVVEPSLVCPNIEKNGKYQTMAGVGFQDVVVTRDHDRHFGRMTKKEIELVLEAYISRFQALRSEPCVEYILIMHNHGPDAGASVPHPHSQMFAIPLIPPDVDRSVVGSRRYYHKNKRCVHCDMIRWDIKGKTRIIFENKHCVVLAPFASRVSFEARIYPKMHESRFEVIDIAQRQDLAEAMQFLFSKFVKNVKNPDYNFVIHTAPPKKRDARHYHWHLEILPRVGIWGGLELGSGIEVVKVMPEEAAKILKK